MAAVIENPVLNSPFVEPTKHFRFSDDGITDEVMVSRPFPKPETGKIAVKDINHYGDEVL